MLSDNLLKKKEKKKFIYNISNLHALRGSSWFPRVSFLLKDDVRDEQDEACREEHNEELVDGQDILQSVDPLLHGTGVEVIVHGCPDAPHHPHYIHYQLHASVF